MVFKLRLVEAFGTRRIAEGRFRKYDRNSHHKSITPVTNILQKEGPEKLFLEDFLGPHPGLVFRASPDSLQGPKACLNGVLEMDFV